jgi:EamA domain-containing membrane protein RarD
MDQVTQGYIAVLLAVLFWGSFGVYTTALESIRTWGLSID